MQQACEVVGAVSRCAVPHLVTPTSRLGVITYGEVVGAVSRCAVPHLVTPTSRLGVITYGEVVGAVSRCAVPHRVTPTSRLGVIAYGEVCGEADLEGDLLCLCPAVNEPVFASVFVWPFSGA